LKVSKVFKFLSSLKLTLFCLALAMVLVFVGTLDQVHLGTFAAQKIYFDSWWVWRRIGGLSWPLLPGGLTVGLLWAVNLVFAHGDRFSWDRRRWGITLTHLGLLILLGGQFFTQLSADETQLPFREGETLNYSESPRRFELALTAPREGGGEDVYVIPDTLLRRGGEVRHPALPFVFQVRRFYENAVPVRDGSGDPTGADRGIGARLTVRDAPPVSTDEELNNVSITASVSADGKSEGTWFLSPALGMPQSVFHGGREYRLALRHRRRYFPFSLTLREFRHDIYPGTNIPKNFSSLVRLEEPDRAPRDVLIYMNHPLRHGGLTFYQASFGDNDTLSILQVVKNPAWITPYLGCGVVALGLALQFLMRLMKMSPFTPPKSPPDTLGPEGLAPRAPPKSPMGNPRGSSGNFRGLKGYVKFRGDRP
jgi:hypothetical protein